MIVPHLLFATAATVLGQATGGTLGGTVLNASRHDAPVAGAEVVLRTTVAGRLVPVARTTADRHGRFVFRGLAVGSQHVYLPGANRQGVHYPGPRVRLTPAGRRRRVALHVRDATTGPSPLVIRHQRIAVRPEAGALRVTESILVANPSSETYVGRPGAHGRPVTLRLAVPADFERLTFDREFFGRRFSMVDGKLETGIPWTPGERELGFTYVLPAGQTRGLWRRPLDLPCSRLELAVRTDSPQEVRCNLPSRVVERAGGLATVRFESTGRTLPAGHVIRLELGGLPTAWRDHTRWAALVLLGLLLAMAVYAVTGRRGRRPRPTAPASPPGQGPAPPAASSSRRRRRPRNRRRRQASRRAA